MDNITHSLTGVLAGRLVRDEGPARRALFWASLMAVNVPDADVVANLFVDPITSLHTHRGITHSLLASPILALVPAGVTKLFAREAPFRLLWTVSFLCVIVHIFFDVVTAYGTQILYPLVETRFALDWVFIIDPWFTLTLLALAVPARWLERWRRRLRVASVAFIVVYLSAAISLRTMALGKFERLLGDSMRPAAAGAPTPAESAGELTGAPTVLPQPLAFTRWVGLARTDSGLVRSFVNALEGETALETFVNANDRFVDSAMTTSHVRDYLRFARFPYVMSGPVSGGRLVEFRDYQFSVDPWIIRAFGAAERDVPFVMQMRYDSTARLVSVLFNNKPVPLER